MKKSSKAGLPVNPKPVPEGEVGTGTQGSWIELLNTEGAEVADSALRCCIVAEVLLIQAVSVAGIEWCLGRLEQAKDTNGDMESVLDIVLRRNGPAVQFPAGPQEPNQDAQGGK